MQLINRKISINLDVAKKILSERINLEAEEYLKDVKNKMIDAIIDDNKTAQQALKARKKSLMDAKDDPQIWQAKSIEDLRSAVPEIIKNYRLNTIRKLD